MPTASESGIKTALNSLLPPSTLPSGVPAKLTSHAVTLLNLSRQRAPNLKAEEEIARAHACAEIACRKLRVQLRLPNTKTGAGAPAKPAVYKRLLAFLEGRLEDVGISTPKSGRKRDAEEAMLNGRTTSGSASVKRVRRDLDIQHDEDEEMSDVQATPTKKGGKFVSIDVSTSNIKTKKSSLGTPRTPQKGKKIGTVDSSSDDGAAPSYAMTWIRKLCQTFNTTKLAPHVYTGSCIIIKQADIWSKDKGNEKEEDKAVIGSLIIALYLMVLTRMQKGKMTMPVYTSTCDRSIKAIQLADAKEVKSSVEAWISRINENGWAVGQDWWDTVPEGVLNFTSGDQTEAEIEADEALNGDDLELIDAPSRHAQMVKNLDEPDPEGILLPGLGTMMQDAVDWLSEDRNLEFEEWKEDIMRRLQIMDRATGKKARAAMVS